MTTIQTKLFRGHFFFYLMKFLYIKNEVPCAKCQRHTLQIDRTKWIATSDMTPL